VRFVPLTEEDIAATADPELFRSSFEVLREGVIRVTNLHNFVSLKGDLITFTFEGFQVDTLDDGLRRLGDVGWAAKYGGRNIIVVIREGNFGVSLEEARHSFDFQPCVISHGPEYSVPAFQKISDWLDRALKRIDKKNA
jgi:hypothetical protein